MGVISEILSKKQSRRNSIKSIVTDGHIISDNKIIAEKFNDFFPNVGPTLAASLRSNVSRTHKSYLNENILTSFHGISIKPLKFLSPALVKPLSLIINQSLITGIFPERLKRAEVLPLFKKGDETLIENCRQVYLLTPISKVFEKVVFIQLSKYFQDNGLFYESQYGFRENHWTELATVELLDHIMSALDHKELPISIYIDLSKTFDTLDNSILIDKLSHYGIKYNALKWFSSYLSNRTMFVEIDNAKSSVRHLTTGVPQGCILGPLLFLIYMNDISNSSSLFKFIMFADDTNLFTTIECTLPVGISKVDDLVNHELEKIYDWLTVNRLSLNLTKTKLMIFHPKQKDISSLLPKLVINNIPIKKLTTSVLLGVCQDSNLKWDGHMQFLATKLGKYTENLNKLKRYVPVDILRIL